MVRCWYMDDSTENQRLEHFLRKSEFVALEEVAEKTGVLYWKLNVENYEKIGSLDEIKKARGYTYQDVIEVCPGKLPNYEEMIKIFFTEHLHADEEIRFVLEGSGYLDVRDDKDVWIRIEIIQGDLIILPAGIYHRFTLDMNDHIKVMRLFAGSPVWTAHCRPCDDMEARIKYLKQMQKHKNKIQLIDP